MARVRVYGLNFASAPANCVRIRPRSSVRATTCSWISNFVRAQPHWVCDILTGLPQVRVRVNVSNIASDRAHSASLGLELGLTGFGLGFEVRLGLAGFLLGSDSGSLSFTWTRARACRPLLELGLTGFPFGSGSLGFEVRLGLAFTRFGFVLKVRLQSGLMFKLGMLIYIYF